MYTIWLLLHHLFHFLVFDPLSLPSSPPCLICNSFPLFFFFFLSFCFLGIEYQEPSGSQVTAESYIGTSKGSKYGISFILLLHFLFLSLTHSPSLALSLSLSLTPSLLTYSTLKLRLESKRFRAFVRCTQASKTQSMRSRERLLESYRTRNETFCVLSELVLRMSWKSWRRRERRFV